MSRHEEEKNLALLRGEAHNCGCTLPPLHKHAEGQENNRKGVPCLDKPVLAHHVQYQKNVSYLTLSTIVATRHICSVVMELHQHNIYTFC